MSKFLTHYQKIRQNPTGKKNLNDKTSIQFSAKNVDFFYLFREMQFNTLQNTYFFVFLNILSQLLFCQFVRLVFVTFGYCVAFAVFF